MTTGSPTVSGLSDSSVTLVEGSTFAISSSSGDIVPGGAQGLFFEDTRFISCWQMLLDDSEVQNLAAIQHSPFDATFLTREQPRENEADSKLFVSRNRFVGNGMREDISIRNLDREAAVCHLTFAIDSDFSHIFDVKKGRAARRGDRSLEVSSDAMVLSYSYHDVKRQLQISLPPQAVVKAGRITLRMVIQPHEEAQACFEFHLSVEDEPVELRYLCGVPVEYSTPATRLRLWEEHAPRMRTARSAINATLEQSVRDLGALRIFDPDHPERVAVAAGAPWFMTLFGRDSLITAMMSLVVDQDLAAGTLLTLAQLQGDREHAITEEQPGKILHELRRGFNTFTDESKDSIYYGSIDATPLFVIALAELHRWGLDEQIVREMLPHADRGLRWVDEFGDRDGDGFVEYQRATGRGLVNQGWKDSFDSVNFANRRIVEPSIALCEEQAYVYSAFLSRASLARAFGDEDTARTLEARAASLKEAFNERFWLQDRGYFALGLDGEKNLIDSLTSNIGHCLWAGIVDDDKAAQVVADLCGPEMFTGWGIRTLSSAMGAYNPVSYHNGSVWPHDSAIAAAGFMRYGFVDEAHKVTTGLFQAADAFGGRLPELLCGFDRARFPVPVRYPTSCSPQAWSSAAPLWLLRKTLLQLEPCLPEGKVFISPSIPDTIGPISLENMPLGNSRVKIEASGTTAKVSGLPEDITVVHERRDPQH